MSRILFLILFFLAGRMFACSCSFDGDFFETIDKTKNNLLIEGKIVGQQGYFYQIKIDKVIKGSIDVKTINLMTGNGANCWEIITENDIGDSYVFNLTELSNDTVKYFGLSECGTSKLKVIDNKVQGRISGGIYQNQELQLIDFLEIYEKKCPLKKYFIKDIVTNEFMQLNGKGQRIGKWKIFNFFELITEEGKYNYNGQKNGKWTYYQIKEEKVNDTYQRKTVLKKIVVYKNGRLWKVVNYYDKEGNKLEVGNMKKGYGELFEYYNTGQLYGKYTYFNGVKEGVAEEYKNGSVEKGEFKNGLKEGIWEIYEDDTLTRKVIYQEGKKIKEDWLD